MHRMYLSPLEPTQSVWEQADRVRLISQDMVQMVRILQLRLEEQRIRALVEAAAAAIVAQMPLVLRQAEFLADAAEVVADRQLAHRMERQEHSHTSQHFLLLERLEQMVLVELRVAAVVVWVELEMCVMEAQDFLTQ